ncbi:MAG: isopentenyl-diphosphate Delta-isomerase [Alphaproteobacteria bacterium]|jgi:isopentenyl-diphosphate delta-isomerase
MAEHVILVDEADREVGTMEKLEAHRRGLPHRAFSIFVFSPDRQCLIQRRAAGKYHSGGLWSNACCGHPRPGEDMDAAAGRRLKDELGVACDLRKVIETRYDLDVGDGLREAEYNHTYLGMLDTGAALRPDPEECSAARWMPAGDIEEDMAARPGAYSAWFVLLFPKILVHL